MGIVIAFYTAIFSFLGGECRHGMRGKMRDTHASKKSIMKDLHSDDALREKRAYSIRKIYAGRTNVHDRLPSLATDKTATDEYVEEEHAA